jgi:hypothetical protein
VQGRLAADPGYAAVRRFPGIVMHSESDSNL